MKAIDIKISPEYIRFCKEWYGGQASMMYAIASTGNLTLGGNRPYDEDGEPMDDMHWQISLYEQLASEVDEILEADIKSANDKRLAVHFEDWIDRVLASIPISYQHIETYNAN